MSDLHHGGLGANPGASEDDAARKRKHNESCKASRKRIKQDKHKLESLIAELKAEIAEKKKTSPSLEQKRNMKSLMQGLLKSKIIELQRRIAELEKEEDAQIKQLEALSELPNLAEEDKFSSLAVEMHRNGLAVWSQTKWDDWASEKTKLNKEITELRIENTKLNIQMRVLNEKIIHCREQGNP